MPTGGFVVLEVKVALADSGAIELTQPHSATMAVSALVVRQVRSGATSQSALQEPKVRMKMPIVTGSHPVLICDSAVQEYDGATVLQKIRKEGLAFPVKLWMTSKRTCTTPVAKR